MKKTAKTIRTEIDQHILENSFEYSDNVTDKPPYIECDIFGSPKKISIY